MWVATAVVVGDARSEHHICVGVDQQQSLREAASQPAAPFAATQHLGFILLLCGHYISCSLINR